MTDHPFDPTDGEAAALEGSTAFDPADYADDDDDLDSNIDLDTDENDTDVRP